MTQELYETFDHTGMANKSACYARYSLINQLPYIQFNSTLHALKKSPI